MLLGVVSRRTKRTHRLGARELSNISVAASHKPHNDSRHQLRAWREGGCANQHTQPTGETVCCMALLCGSSQMKTKGQSAGFGQRDSTVECLCRR